MAKQNAPIDPSRSAGAAFGESVERDKAHRDKARSFKPLLKLWPFAARYKVRMGLFLIFLAASTFMTLGVTFLVRGIIDCGFGGADAPAYCSALPAMNASEGGSSLTPFFLAALLFAVCFALISSTRAYLINTLGEKIVADIRAAVFGNLMRLSPAYFERVRTGEVLSRLTTDTTLVETVVTGSISFAIRSLATIVGALVLMFIVSWKLSLMVLAIGPLIIIPAIIAGKFIQKLSRGGQDMLAQASARAGESLSSIQTVQAFTREDYESENFSGDIYKTYAIQNRRLKARFYLMSFIISAGMMSVIGILWYGAASVQAGRLDGGAIGQFALLAFLVVSNAGMLSETWTNLLRAAGASERLTEILGEQPGIAAPKNPAAITNIDGNIAFENVSFAYPSRPGEQAIDNISFTVKPGETVALVGPSGAGKSTIFQLLLRFYDTQSGQIQLDGQDIKSFAPADLRRQFAIVQQNTPLFSGSAMDNIRYGRIGASDEDVIAAAKAAHADTFIRKLPNGYDTDLGERAATLSGGQRQRIAIARAILRTAPILLLDEATSALDAESELAVQNAFEALSKDRTTLVIAHRLATVLQSDRIIVLDEGRIDDQGTHADLIKRGGLYARLAELQFSQNA